MTDSRYVCTMEDAPRIADWLINRGGIAVWSVIDLSRAGESSTTPLLRPNGARTAKPGWQYDDQPSRIITDPTERVRKAVGKAGEGAYYQFDYARQEAVIFKPTAAYKQIAEVLPEMFR